MINHLLHIKCTLLEYSLSQVCLKALFILASCFVCLESYSNHHMSFFFFLSIEMIRRMHWNSTRTPPTSLSSGGRKCCKPRRTREKKREDRRCVCLLHKYVFVCTLSSCFTLYVLSTITYCFKDVKIAGTSVSSWYQNKCCCTWDSTWLRLIWTYQQYKGHQTNSLCFHSTTGPHVKTVSQIDFLSSNQKLVCLYAKERAEEHPSVDVSLCVHEWEL